MAMVISMTGFGRAAADTPVGKFVVELRSVNHRGLDVKVRGRDFPPEWEVQIGRIVRQNMRRGSVSVSLDLNRAQASENTQGESDEAFAALEEAQRHLVRLQKKLGLQDAPDLATIVQSLPFFAEMRSHHSLRDLPWDSVAPIVEDAVKETLAMRGQEGQALAVELEKRRQNLVKLKDELAELTHQTPEKLGARLRERITALVPTGTPVDAMRLEQEIAFLCDRADVTEELVRLGTHLDHVQAVVTDNPSDAEGAGDGIGRKLDFLVQEIGREINTLGSKSQDANIAARVVEAKAELEKLREQAQNVE